MSQALGDALAGAFGHDVNRPGLEAFVANSQSANGLRSAQTQEALLKAQQMQEEQQANSQLEDAFVNAGLPGSQAHLAAIEATRIHGSAKDALEAVKGVQQINATSTLGDVNQLNSPTQTAAQQALTGKVAEPVAVHPEYATLPGMNTPNVQQTPLGAAQTGAQHAIASLRQTQSDAGGFRPQANPAGAADPRSIEMGGYQLYKTNTMPALGMGGGAIKAAMLAKAADFAQQEAQSGQPISMPEYDAIFARGQDFKGGTKAVSAFGSGPTSDKVRAINNVVGHLQLFDDTFKALQNGDVQGLNKLGNAWQSEFGAPVPTTLNAMGNIVGPELTKSLANTGSGSEEERTNFIRTAGSLGNSPEQTHGAVQAMRGMLGRQLNDFEQQYHGATGRDDFRDRYIPPDVQKLMAPHAPPVLGGQAPAGRNPMSDAAPTPAPAAAPLSLDAFLRAKGY